MALREADGFLTEYNAELRITAGAWDFLQSALTGSSKSPDFWQVEPDRDGTQALDRDDALSRNWFRF